MPALILLAFGAAAQPMPDCRQAKTSVEQAICGNAELAAVVGDLVMKWHRTGHIQEVEKTWRIPPSMFADEMHRRYADAE